MVITSQKKHEEILKYLSSSKKIFIVGCGACATVCKTGGEEEVWQMEEFLSKNKKEIIGDVVIDEVCHLLLTRRAFREHKEEIDKADAILVMACGTGIQAVVASTSKKVYPALDTLFIGVTKHIYEFQEWCNTCGECLLAETNGICPIARCPKHMLNGPCGGVVDGKCEIDPELDCPWILIYKRNKESLKKFRVPRDNSKRARPGIRNLKNE